MIVGVVFLIMAVIIAFKGFIPLAVICSGYGIALVIIGVVAYLMYETCSSREDDEEDDEDYEEDANESKAKAKSPVNSNGFDRDKFRKETLKKFYDEFQL